MPDYAQSKIYKLESLGNPNAPVYVGATTQSLSQRFCDHKKSYKRWKDGKYPYTTSFKLFEDFDDVIITLLEEVECENVGELNACEVKWIRALNCVNKIHPTRTKKEHYNDNKQEILEKSRVYRKEHRDELIEYSRNYRKNNPDKNKELCQKYYDSHKKEISEKNKEKRRIKKEIENEIKSMMLILI